MRSVGYLVFALAVGAVASSPASAAGICRAEGLSCATTMPVGGYCECTSRGVTQSGTVADRSASNQRTNSTAGGCGVNPHAPGCR